MWTRHALTCKAKEFQLDIGSRHASDLDMRINGVYLPGMWLGYFGYGPPVTIRAMGRDDYWLQFPLGGPFEMAGRTLFMHFKAVTGVSPMRYVCNARLRQVRQALLEAGPEASVTSIATDAGFTHLGRFSIVYRRRFGESPSDYAPNPQAGATPVVGP